MAHEQERAARLLQLSTEEYFAFDEDRKLDLQDALAEIADVDAVEEETATAPILALGAPDRVNLEERNTVPVLVGSVETGMRGWRVNFEPNLHLFVKSRSTGELRFATPLIDMRRGLQPLRSGVGAPPDEFNAAAMRSLVALVDLGEELESPLTPGLVVVTAVENELRSNSVEIRLEGEARGEAPRRSPEPYVRADPDSGARSTTGVTVPGTGSASGSIGIRVVARTGEDAGILQADSEQPVLPCHVVLVRLDERPVVVPASAPVRRSTGPDGEDVFLADFTVELGAAGHPVPVGDSQVYVDVGTELLGPFPLRVTE